LGVVISLTTEDKKLFVQSKPQGGWSIFRVLYQ